MNQTVKIIRSIPFLGPLPWNFRHEGMKFPSTLNELPPSMTEVSVPPSPLRSLLPPPSLCTPKSPPHWSLSYPISFHYTCHYQKLSCVYICFFIIFCLPSRFRVYLKLGFPKVDPAGYSSGIISYERKGEEARLDRKTSVQDSGPMTWKFQ